MNARLISAANEMHETYLPGVPEGPERHVEVTGVDFYRTIEELPLLKPLIRQARRRVFDIYHLGGSGAAWLTRLLRRADTGLLSAYVVWFVLGLLALLYFMNVRISSRDHDSMRLDLADDPLGPW